MSIGFDVSKETVDVTFFDGRRIDYIQIENNQKGFEQILRKNGNFAIEDQHVTMESTGVYHERIRDYFYNRGYRVTVVNPLIIKRYCEMKMMRAKTDSVDSRMIAMYGFYEKTIPYRAISEKRAKIKAFLKIIDDFKRMKIQNRNRLEALSHSSAGTEDIQNIYVKLNRVIDEQIKDIEKKIITLAEEENKEAFNNLKTIPGVGERIAAAITGYFGKLENFETAKQMVSFIGINPSVKQSGKSVRGRGSISRKGNSYLRKLLYLAALSASKHNADCSRLYERLLSQGKEKKLALIAVANKLARQIFAIVKYNRVYDPFFSSVK